MDNMKKIGVLINTQDNRITDAPMFIVEKKVRDYGYDCGYSDYYEWLDCDNGHECASPEEAEQLDSAHEAMESTAGWEKVFYKDRWEFVTACFTESGCKDYLAINKHNLGECRIYADGSYRNNEFRSIRNFLSALAK